MPKWYLKLMYRLGRKPHYYFMKRNQKEMVRFCAINQIDQELQQTNCGIYLIKY